MNENTINPTVPNISNLQSTQATGQNNTDKKDVPTNIKKPNLFVYTYEKIDRKLEKLVPSKLLRKVVIITAVSFTAIFIILFLLAAIFASSRQQSPVGFLLNKPNITQENPTTVKVNTPIQQRLTDLRKEINDTKFPQSNLGLPILQTGLTIDSRRR